MQTTILNLMKMVETLLVWESLNFVVWERVNVYHFQAVFVLEEAGRQENRC